jgi:hypothetical protein
MSDSHPRATDSGFATPVSRALNDGRVWLAIAMGLGTLVALTYYLTHPYPAFGAGLYLKIAESVLANGYQPPTAITGYTTTGVPFAYPPLAYYLVAVLIDLGFDPLAISRVLPGVMTVVYLVPFFYLAREVLDSVRQAGLATVIVALTPVVLQWHVSAGGIVRAQAFFLLLSGLYCGVKLFENGRRWLPPAVALFGLTILAHPTYTAFYGVSYLLVFVFRDRSWRGLVNGAAVAAGGVLLAAPWWIGVAMQHGVERLTGAAATHGGLGGSPGAILGIIIDPIAAMNAMSLWYVLAILGSLYLLGRRRAFVPVWFLVGAFVMSEPRFSFVPGAMAIAVLLADAPPFRFSRTARRPTIRLVASAVLAVLVGFMLVSSGMYAAGAPVAQQNSLPAFLDDEDMAAMEWIYYNTRPDATFVALGDAAEWFPLLTDRTIAVGPWGVEWKTPQKYRHQLGLFWFLSTCNDEECLSAIMDRRNVEPNYVYVPKGEYTVRGFTQTQPPEMRASLLGNENYRLVYENEGVMVFEVLDQSAGGRANNEQARLEAPGFGPDPNLDAGPDSAPPLASVRLNQPNSVWYPSPSRNYR